MNLQTSGAGDAERDSESFGEWRLVFTHATGSVADRSWAVQIEHQGVLRARLSVSNPGLDESRASAALREKARRWIVEFESRPHEGDTDFASI